MNGDRIEDLERFRSLREQIRGFQSFKRIFPVLKPFLKLCGVNIEIVTPSVSIQRLICSLSLVLALPIGLLAQQVHPIEAVVSHVNVRAQPPTDMTKVGKLRPGETATLLDSIPSYYKVRLGDNMEGFVSKRWTVRIKAGLTEFAVHFLDDGTGDSAIIDIGEHEIVVDGGNSTRVLHDYNHEHEIIDGPIELVIVTHADTDHWKGLRRILGFDTIGTHVHTLLEFWEPGYDRDCNPTNNNARQNYLSFISEVEAIDAVTFRRPLEETLTPAVDSNNLDPIPLASVPEIEIVLLHSEKEPPGPDCSYQINNASIVFMATIDTLRFLFSGDANGKDRDEPSPGTPSHVEKRLLDLDAAHTENVLRAHVLKAPHHGSETANTQAFIDAVNPQVVVFSASTRHHLPRPSVIRRYGSPGRTILRTDRTETPDGVPSNDNDHILCKIESHELECSYLGED